MWKSGHERTHPTRTMCETRKNSKKAFRMKRTEKIVAKVKAARPITPQRIQPCVKSNFSGRLYRSQ